LLFANEGGGGGGNSDGRRWPFCSAPTESSCTVQDGEATAQWIPLAEPDCLSPSFLAEHRFCQRVNWLAGWLADQGFNLSNCQGYLGLVAYLGQFTAILVDNCWLFLLADT
jgi:hypothetical protein